MKSVVPFVFGLVIIVGGIGALMSGLWYGKRLLDSNTEAYSGSYGRMDYLYDNYPALRQDIRDAVSDGFLSRLEEEEISDKKEEIDLVIEKAKLEKFLSETE